MGSVSQADLSSFEADGQVRGLESCVRQGSGEVAQGAVVCILWSTKAADKGESEVVVIGSLVEASLKVFVERDVRRRLEAIALHH